MSHIATFDIYYDPPQEVTIQEIIELYLSYGWTIDKFGYISLRPLGDKDDFNWIELRIDQRNELYETINQKIKAGEDPAVAMTWDTDDGVIFTFFPNEKRINYLLMGHRTRHPDFPNFTDVNLYFVLLYKPLLAKQYLRQNVAFSVVRSTK